MSCEQLDYHHSRHNISMTLWIPQGVTLYLQGTLQLKPWLLFQEGMFLYKPLQIVLCWKTQGQTSVSRQPLPTIAILTQAIGYCMINENMFTFLAQAMIGRTG